MDFQALAQLLISLLRTLLGTPVLRLLALLQVTTTGALIWLLVKFSTLCLSSGA